MAGQREERVVLVTGGASRCGTSCMRIWSVPIERRPLSSVGMPPRRENVESVTGTVIHRDAGMGVRGAEQVADLHAPQEN